MRSQLICALIAASLFIELAKSSETPALPSQGTETSFFCNSPYFRNDFIPPVAQPPELTGQIQRRYSVPSNPDERAVVYEAEHYPMISKSGLLPPQYPGDNFNFTAYFFTAARYEHHFGVDFEADESKLPYMRLPYKYESNFHLECVVYTVNNERFIVLEDFQYAKNKIKIPIRQQTTKEGTMREFMHLPYVNAPGTILTKQTWIIRQHLEPETGAPLQYGYFELPDSQPIRIPVNAYYVHSHNFVRKVTDPSLNNKGVVEAIFSVSWLPGLCYFFAWKGTWFTKEMCKKQEWKIHSFFSDSRRKANWNSADIHVFADTEFNHAGRDKLLQFWPSLTPTLKHETFWRLNWLKHGRHMYDHPRDYFRAALDLHDTYAIEQLTDRLALMGFSANDTAIYNYKDLMAKMFNERERGSFICVQGNHHISILVEMRLCIRRDESGKWSRIDCNPNVKSCHQDIIVPESYTVVPYMMLMVYKMPTMAFRIAKRTNTPLSSLGFHDTSKEVWDPWYISCLKAPVIYATITKLYLKNVAHLKHYDPNIETEYLSANSVKWPNIDANYWRIKYRDYGTVLRFLNVTRVRGARNYFQTAIELFDNLHTDTWRTDPILRRLDEPLETETVKEALKSHVNADVVVYCIEQNGKQFLAKVAVCINHSFQVINCPKSLKDVQRSTLLDPLTLCPHQLVIPSLPETIK